MVEITKEDLKKALQEMSQYDKIFKPEGRFVLCKEIWGDGRGKGDSNTEMECSDYFDEGIDELYNTLFKNAKICDNK